MIYSKWRPDRGGYDYFEASERRGLGDDLPTPHLTSIGAPGVASTSAGRPLPSGARHVGAGPLARGVIAPLDRRGLSLSGTDVPLQAFAALLGIGGAIGYFLCLKLEK